MKKKRVKRIAKRLIGMLLAVVMICYSPLAGLFSYGGISQIKAAGLAAEKAAEANEAWSAGDVEEVPYSPLVGELTEERTQGTKTFLREDGAREVIVYSYAVHYEDDGKWKDIDNALYPVKTAEGTTAYTNGANEYQVWFSEKAEGEYLVKVEKDGYSISWTMPGMNADVKAAAAESSLADGVLSTDKRLLSTPGDLSATAWTKQTGKSTEERDETLRFPSTYLSEITYEDAINGLDVRYVIHPQMVEEFFEASTKAVAASLDEVEIVITCEGVCAQKNRDGSVAFVNEEGEQIFSLGQPYMTDAAGTSSAQIGVSLEPVVEDSLSLSDKQSEKKKTEQYVYKLSPDKEWLESDERTYPVSVDPNVFTSIACENISDVYIHQKTPDYPHGIAPAKLRLGTHWENENYRTLIRFNTLPALGTDDVVISAVMNLTRFWNSSINNSTDYGDVIEVYRATESWEETTVTWNNQPDCDSLVEAIDIGRDYDAVGRDQYNSFDLTGLVKKWYSGTPNYGVLVRLQDETTLNFYEYMSSEVEYSQEEHPYMSIVYVNSSGIESMWSYHTQSAGRCGVTYVNDYTGALTIIHDTVSVSGGALPISISHVYNSNDRNTDVGFGKGWRLSIMETVSPVTINNTTWYCYLDGDGTKHYYYPSGTSGQYLDEMNAKNKLTVGSGSYTLVNESFITRTFDGNGRLTRISDPNGNAQTITYDGSGRPIYVDDSAGRRATLYYGSSQLAAIQYPDGTQAVCYYTADGHLSHIKDADDGFGYYAYFEDSMVLVDPQGYQLWFYFDTATWRVNSIQSITQGTNIEGPSLDIEYGWNVTSYTDNQGRTELVRFNNQGEPISVQDASGRATYGNYSEAEGMKGKLISLSELQKTSVNLLQNGDVDSTDSWYFHQLGITGTIANGRSTTEGFMGSDSLYMTKGNTAGELAYIQDFAFSAGKTYTFSAYMKGAEGAKLFVQTYKDGAWTHIGTQTALMSADTWNRTSVTVTIPSGATKAQAVVMLPSGYAGTVYIDCLQVEEGELSRYNLLTNSDFRNGTNGWTPSNTETGDGVGTIPSGGTHPSVLNSTGYYLSGNTAKDKYISQTVDVSGSAGDSYVFGGWMKAASIPSIEDETYGNYGYRQLKVIFMNGSIQVGEEVVADFSADTTDWQYLCASATAPGAYTSIIFRFAYPKNCNTAWFDGLQLYKEGFGERYTYTNGNLTQVVDKEDKDTDYVYDPNDNVTSATDKYGDTVSYTYDGKHNVLTSTALETKTTYTYDGKGNVTTTRVEGTGNTSLYLQSGAVYSSNGAFLESVTDARGKTASYTYNTLQGSINTATDPKNNKTGYSYDSIHRISSVAAKDSNSNIVATVFYTYAGDYLSAITRHDSMNYGLVTDTFGNTTAISAAGNTLVTNEYDYLHALLTSSTYGNGYTLTYTYDEYDRLKTVKEGNTTIYTAYYDGDGRLYRSIDGKTGITSQYDYDLSGKLVRAVNSDGTSYQYIYDQKDSLTGIRQTAGGRTWTNSYGYDSQYRPTTTVIGSSSGGTAATISNSYDSLSRLTGQVYDLTNDYTVTLGYTAGANGSQTTQLSSYQNGNESAYQYTYDNNGNITVITYGGQEWRYYYDCLNQLTRVDDPVQNKSILYTYNGAGNILTKSEYGYTTETLGAATSTISYGYSSTWKDQLTSYNGQTISYDGIGNPTTYCGWTFGWSGRNLTSISKSGTTGAYTYNNDGLRTTKTVNGVATTYTYQGSLLMAQQSTGKNLYFSYDTTGKAVSVNYNGTEYYYLRNGQGDIVGLLDQSGTKVVSYIYDSWGKLIETTGTLASTLGVDNPLRYRGYYYDAETGFYWLLSRYYDPEVGRFINADDVSYLGADGTPISYNLYAYCLNNPVNRTDENGSWSLPNWVKVTIGVAAIAAGVIATAVTGGAAAAVLVASVKIAATSAAIGAVSGAGISAVSHRVSTGSWDGVGKSALNGAIDGACDGFMWGGISAGATFTTVAAKGVRVQEIGRLKPSNKSGDGYLGVKYEAPKANGKYTTKSIELHSPHGSGPHDIWHWQQNTWNPYNNSISAKAKHWTLLGRALK